MNVQKLFQWARPHFVKKGKPTKLVTSLRSSKEGEALLKAILAFYLTHQDMNPYVNPGPLDLNINIEHYRWKQ